MKINKKYLPNQLFEARIVQIIIAISMVFVLLSGQSASGEKHGYSNQRFLVPLMTTAPKIDGILDNPLWETQARKISDFKQYVPKNTADVTHKTDVYIGRDKKSLYIAFRAFDSEADKIRYSVIHRDNCQEDDFVSVFLDTFNEKRRAFCFAANPIGVQMDLIRTEEGNTSNMNYAWDTLFQSDGKVDAQGYTVEMAIPFKSIRFPDKENKTWSMFLIRNIARSGEIDVWPMMTQKVKGFLPQTDEIFIQGEVTKGKNFEIMPVVTSLKKSRGRVGFDPGINFKWGIDSNITLDLTVNPDFSHIEADAPQIDVNQRFALYYPEKRPFFQEGMEIFRFPEIRMVYTRQIHDPISGAKLTGKTGAFTYGLLSALDMNPTESLWDISSDGIGSGQNALFNILRVKTDVFKESYLGFAYTDKVLNGSFNRAAGIDGQFRFENHWYASFQAIVSRSRFDHKTTDLSPALYGEFSYNSKNFLAGVRMTAISPDFEASSGFVHRKDYREGGIYAGYRIYTAKKWLSSIGFALDGFKRWGYSDSSLQDQNLSASINFRLTEFSQLNIAFNNLMEHFSGIDFWQNNAEIEGSFLFIRWLTLGFLFQTGDAVWYDSDDPFRGYSNAYAIAATYKPSRRLRITESFTKQTFWKTWGGDKIFDYNVLRIQTTYQLSKTLSLRGIVDYNHFYKEIYGSFLFSYMVNPGTVFFFGVDRRMAQNSGGFYASEDYSVFIKFSYWLRI